MTSSDNLEDLGAPYLSLLELEERPVRLIEGKGLHFGPDGDGRSQVKKFPDITGSNVGNALYLLFEQRWSG